MKTLHVSTFPEWWEWLEQHHESESEVWLVFHKVQTGRASVDYKDALDAALCFGWIDSLIKRLDDERYARKFTPRKADSKWSDVNRTRYAKLKALGKLMPAGVKRAPTDRSYDPLPARETSHCRQEARFEIERGEDGSGITNSNLSRE